MNNRSSALANHGFKGITLTASKDSGIGIKNRERTTFRQFIIKFADVAVTIFLVAVLISAFMQPLFRDLLLDWLRNILENN